MTGCDSGCDSGGLEVTHFRLDVTKTSITSITSGFWPDVTLDGSLPGASPTIYSTSERECAVSILVSINVCVVKLRLELATAVGQHAADAAAPSY